MKIVNSIMPMNDVKALAANGQKLRVAVTKTSAQGEAAQSATPNLMSFSTDENSIWFNGKKYGAYKLNYKLYELSGKSLNQSDIINALDGFTQEHWDLVSEGGIGYMVSPGEGIASTALCSLRAWVDSGHKYLSIVIYGVEGTMYLLFDYNNSSSTYEVTVALDRSYIGRDEIVNNLTSTDTDNPLSAAMGKKLNDEKLAKTDVVNSLSDSSTNKALSAAQGKALNDRISGLGNVYRVKGTKRTIEEVYDISADAKLGDVWNITSAFTIGGKPYPANTNVVCIAEWSTSTTPQNNWDPLGGTVDLSTYVPKSDIVDNLLTSDSKKPLSAKQGLALATMITELEDDKETYQLLKTLESDTLTAQSKIDAILGPYSSFNAALNAGKVIHGVYKDSINGMNTVVFSAFNDTANSRVRMFAILNNSTLLCIQATYSGTNWTSATTSEEFFSASITIE